MGVVIPKEGEERGGACCITEAVVLETETGEERVMADDNGVVTGCWFD